MTDISGCMAMFGKYIYGKQENSFTVYIGDGNVGTVSVHLAVLPITAWGQYR